MGSKKIPLTPFPKGGTREARSKPPFRKGGQGADRERGFPGRRSLPGALLAVALLLTACAEPPATEIDTSAEPRPPVETRSHVDRAVATTGDVLTYTVTVDYDPAYEIELPEPGAEIAGFRIVDVGSEEPREERGRRIDKRWYKLRADLVGSYVLPPVTVSYRPAGAADAEGGAEAETIETSEIFVEVESVLPGDGEVTDIRGLKPLRQIEPPTPWWWFAAGGGALVLLVLTGVLLWRRAHQVVVAPPRPPHEVAFEALDRLRRTDFEDLEAMRLFHFEISEVVRTYVEGRFTLNATDLTTEEIAAHLDELRGLDRDSGERLRRFLAATDQVKFAAYEPTQDEIGESYEGALSFVEATRERPVVTAGETQVEIQEEAKAA